MKLLIIFTVLIVMFASSSFANSNENFSPAWRQASQESINTKCDCTSVQMLDHIQVESQQLTSSNSSVMTLMVISKMNQLQASFAPIPNDSSAVTVTYVKFFGLKKQVVNVGHQVPKQKVGGGF